MEKKSIFQTLNDINVNDHVEKKNELTYLSWAWAWQTVMKIYPDAKYEIFKDENHRPFIEDIELGLMCFTTITINGTTHEMWLPVMDSANNAMKRTEYTIKTWSKYENRWKEKKVAAATMFDINKTIMRCLVKNLAMFGLGLYIYAGEDLPETESVQEAERIERAELEKAKKEIAMAQSRDELTVVWNKYAPLKTNQEFINALKERSKSIAA